MDSPIVELVSAARSKTDHPCLLLAHADVGELARAAEALAAANGWPRLAVGQALSAALLAEPPANRSRTASRWLATRLAELAPGPVVCSEIDLLFTPAWELDPLVLFRNASRTTRLVVLWPGTYVNDVLAYATPQHGHFRTWRHPGVVVHSL
jgi:hypothetical protein